MSLQHIGCQFYKKKHVENRFSINLNNYSIYVIYSLGGVIRGTGSVGLALVLWVVAGIVGTLGALCFAELGTTFSESGEKYVYLRKMYGDFAGFVYLWLYLLLFRAGANSIKAMTFARYALQPFYPQCGPPDKAVILLAVCLICKFKAFIIAANDFS